MLMICISWEPCDHSRWACNIRGFNGWRPQMSCVAPNDHRTGCIAWCSSIMCYTTHTNSMWLFYIKIKRIPIIFKEFHIILKKLVVSQKKRTATGSGRKLEENKFAKKLTENNYPIQIDTLNKCARTFGSLDGYFKHTIHVNMIAVNNLACWRIWHCPANQNAFVQLPF